MEKANNRTYYRITDVFDYFKVIETRVDRDYIISVKNDVDVIPDNLTLLDASDLERITLWNEPIYFCDSDNIWHIYQLSSLYNYPPV